MKIKEIMNDRRMDQLQTFFAVLTAAILLLIVILRALQTGITYDEGYTYIMYSRDLTLSSIPEIFKNSIANNHWLNTISINLAQRAYGDYYNEFLIRLPVLVSFSLYLGLLVWLVHKKKIQFWTFSLFVFSFYVNEFFGLARGYGYSVFLNMAALVLYSEWRQSSKDIYLSLSFLVFSISSTSITLSLIVTASVGIAALARLTKEKSVYGFLKTQWPLLVPGVILCILMLIYNFCVSSDGLPLALSSTGFYGTFAKGFVRMFVQCGNVTSFLAAVGTIFFAGSIIIFFKEVLSSIFLLPLTVHFFLWFLANLLTNIYPPERGVLASFPLIVCSIVEIAGWYGEAIRNKAKNIKIILPCLKVILTVLLIASFSKNVSLYRTKEWSDNYIVKYQAYAHFNERSRLESYPSELSSAVFFYREKIFYEYGFDILAGEYRGKGIYNTENFD